MDKLQAILASKRKQTEPLQSEGRKKFVKRSEIEQAELERLRAEELQEIQAKAAAKKQRCTPEVEQEPSNTQLTDEQAAATLDAYEVKRRLRVLGEPTTLFGETDQGRYERLIAAERNVQIEDEAAGGQQANLNLEIQREEKARRKLQPKITEPTRTDADAAGGGDKDREQSNELDDEQQKLMKAFAVAAEELADKQLSSEELVFKWFKKWVKEWEEYLDSRPEEEQTSPEGYQASVRFKETKEYFKPLFARLKNRSVDEDMLKGLRIIVEDMKDRNYLQAYKIYMRIAIGNSPWPIGVTHVGLHERSAREKISFKHATGAAHIMNDEATRKYIQAIKRLMSFVQRKYPTDPSRAVDFGL